MKPVTVNKLVEVLNAGPVQMGPAGEVTVTGVSVDSRTIQPGDCFFAVKGENFDGNDFLEDALAKGAACAVTTIGAGGSGGQAVIKVGDTIRALGSFAKWYRDAMGFKVIAVTGSAGKTTTKQIIGHVLSRRLECHQSPKSFNNDIGLPLTILSADEGHQIVVAELGSNAPGEIAKLANIARPEVALITNIYPAHLEGFGSIEAIIKEKCSIAEGLKSNTKDSLFINGDFGELVDYCTGSGFKFTTFGRSGGCEIMAANLITTASGGALTIDGCTVGVPLPGRANLENTLAAWSVCKQFDVSIAEFADAVKTLTPAGMRLQRETVGPVTVIDDSYNANPASMANALDHLAQIAGEKQNTARAVFICGEMAELGDQSGALHAELGGQIAACNVNLLLAAGDFAKIVADAAEKDAGGDFKAHTFENTDELCDNLQDFLQPNDIILVKASRCAAFERAVEKIKQIFA